MRAKDWEKNSSLFKSTLIFIPSASKAAKNKAPCGALDK